MRKAVQLALALLLCATFLPAQQSVTYDFEDGQMPADFTLYNVDMLTPWLEDDAPWAETAWIASESSRFDGFAALSISWYIDEDGNETGPSDDWMILPKFELGAGAELSFQVSSATTSGDYPDDYQVLINTGDATVESFADNGEIIASAQGVPNTFQDVTVDLSNYAGQAIHIAFRNVTNTNGYGLWIDNITVSGIVTTATRKVDNQSFAMKLTPNPAGQGRVQLSYVLPEAAEAELLIQDMMGRTLRRLPQGRLPAGNQQALIDINDLSTGTYIVSVRTDLKIGTAKMIVRH